MTGLLRLAVFAFFALAGCQSLSEAPEKPASLELRQLHVNGTDLAYITQGRGIPIVFIHGAFSDYRFWESQRETFANRYQFIALNLRYHGAAPWPDNATNYSEATHAADVAAFISALGVGPVYLVGVSYGANIALDVALAHPDLVFGLVMEEPAAPALISGPQARAALNEIRRAVENARAMLRGGDAPGATKLFAEWARNMGRDSFELQSESFQTMALENARTLRAFLDRKRSPPLTCEQLSLLKPSTLIINGAKTKRFFALSGDAISRCISTSRHVVIPNATHGIAEQDPAAFNAAVLKFLSTN